MQITPFLRQNALQLMLRKLATFLQCQGLAHDLGWSREVMKNALAHKVNKSTDFTLFLFTHFFFRVQSSNPNQEKGILFMIIAMIFFIIGIFGFVICLWPLALVFFIIGLFLFMTPPPQQQQQRATVRTQGNVQQMV